MRIPVDWPFLSYDSLADFGVSGFGYPVEDYGDFYKDPNNDGIRNDAFPSWSIVI